MATYIKDHMDYEIDEVLNNCVASLGQTIRNASDITTPASMDLLRLYREIIYERRLRNVYLSKVTSPEEEPPQKSSNYRSYKKQER